LLTAVRQGSPPSSVKTALLSTVNTAGMSKNVRGVHLIAVQLFLLVGLGNGFGPRLEPLHNRAAGSQQQQHLSHTDLLVVLKASNSSSEDADPSGFSSMEFGLYDFPPAACDSLDDFALLTYQQGFDGTFTFLQEQADIMALEAFEDNWVDVVDDFCSGEDCDECEIPEDWKTNSGPIATVDVMEFLGISRAKPLTLPSVLIHAWE
jgi:hypothetical protein